jgi:hypothetical protein
MIASDSYRNVAGEDRGVGWNDLEREKMSSLILPVALSTHSTNTRQGQFLIKIGDLNWWKPVLATQLNHGMETTLNTLQNFGVSLEDSKNFGVCLLEHADSFC